MNTQMLFVHRSIRKRFSAKLTYIWFLSSMRPLVAVAVCTSTKTFVAIHTFEDFLVEMRPKMNFQTIIRLCAEHTQMASEWAII